MPLIKKYFDLDLSLKPTHKKDFRKKVDQDAINQHLKLLILTEQNDIPFRNNVSADLRNLLFQPYTLPVQEAMSAVIRNIIKQYEPRIEVKNVINTQSTNQVSIRIEYVIRQTRVVGQFKTILKLVH